jgi:hypothetical protein
MRVAALLPAALLAACELAGEQAATGRRELGAPVQLVFEVAGNRLPWPNDLLRGDRGLELPAPPWDSEATRHLQERVRALDGFGLSSSVFVDFSAELDPRSIAGAFELWQLSDPPVSLPVEVRDWGRTVQVTPVHRPLREGTAHAVVVRDSLRGRRGEPVQVMADGRQLLAAGSGGGARMTAMRRALAPLWRQRGDDRLVAAWTFTTLAARRPLTELLAQPERLEVPVQPFELRPMTPLEALADFPLPNLSFVHVRRVVHGAIAAPYFLDPTSDEWRRDGGYEVAPVGFTITLPRVKPGLPVPVAIFGHGLGAERRTVLAIGDALAARGIAAVAIDLPYHGSRTRCWSEGSHLVFHPIKGSVVDLGDPCTEGSRCSAEGRCVDEHGAPSDLRRWPLIGMPLASGALFVDVGNLPGTADHVRQALVDQAALLRSLRSGAWSEIVGGELGAISYVGQSLGSVLGATFGSAAALDRVVLNVPGADPVGIFATSPVFRSRVSDFFTAEGVAEDSFAAQWWLEVARWLVDPVDPLIHGSHLDPDRVLLQMSLLDFVIPNAQTRLLEAVSGAPRRDYLATHFFLCLPLEAEYFRGAAEMGGFLAGSWAP